MIDNIIDTVEAIKDDIVVDKCVLILGPDLYVKEIDDVHWERKQYFQKLEKDMQGTIYFENDEVFSVSRNELSLGNQVKNFYNGTGDASLLKLIASIKFPLILNASPDESLKKYFEETVPSFSFSHFEGERDQKKDLPFSSSHPLIYNVLGTVSDRQSLIITHNTLYERMQQVLPKDSFPQSIRDYIKNANSFLFLGFKFDSWSYQLLSYKILSENPVKERIIRLSSSDLNKDQSVNIIMSSAMGMDFTENSSAQLLGKIVELLKRDSCHSFLRELNRVEKYTAFLSYAHEDENNLGIESVVRMLEKSFATENQMANSQFKLAIDNKDLPFGQSIDSFMTRIGKGKTVILVVSNKYLKSSYCMIEAMRVHKYNNEDGRVFVILIEDDIAQENKKIDTKTYKDYWQQQLIELTTNNDMPNKNKMNDLLDISAFINELIDKIQSYKYFGSRTTDVLGDKNTGFNFNEPQQTVFDKFMQDIFSKMKED